ncbi:MAG: hypothetical protein JWO74_2776 [Solirubrobacterales bacterium]|jgi:hypothetical protein|nr:hypothetical protein [Solirubrobacterales bacterium]
MAITIEVSMTMKAEDPDSPEAEEIALDLIEAEAQDFAQAVRRRLEENGIKVKSFSMATT